MFKSGDKVWDEKSDKPCVIDGAYDGQSTLFWVRYIDDTHPNAVRGASWLQHIADYIAEEEHMIDEMRHHIDCVRRWAQEPNDSNA